MADYLGKALLKFMIDKHKSQYADFEGENKNSKLRKKLILKGYNECEQIIEQIPTADVAEVKHGKWHILPDDPYDESGAPTEEGWYRVIRADGQEMTDYYFNKPTMLENGIIAYWKNTGSVIRAWAKMDGGKNDFKE